jgi:hypothetical protein
MDDTPRERLGERLSTALGTPPESDWSEVERMAQSITIAAGDRPAPTRDRGRSRPALRRPRVLLALLAALLVASGAAAAVSLTAGSSPPVRLGNGFGLCPAESYPYVAVTAQKLVYPPNYPGLHPRKARLTRCFASIRDARADGYTLAPPPAGDTTLAGLYIAPAPPSVRRACRTAQRLIRGVVYCPSRLPAPWGASNLGLPSCPGAGCVGSLMAISGSFTAPLSYFGSAAGIGDVAMWAVPTSWVFPTTQDAGPINFRAGPVYLPAVYCAGFRARLISQTTVRGHPAAWYGGSHCLNGKAAWTLSWRVGRESYAIAADGPANLRRHLIEYIAAHLVTLRPR